MPSKLTRFLTAVAVNGNVIRVRQLDIVDIKPTTEGSCILTVERGITRMTYEVAEDAYSLRRRWNLPRSHDENTLR
ncbi:hypothetical protein [Microcystis phage Mvi-JY20]|uniref:Uncharacterized protein n=1 Tax=Microcystis phage Mvi-JY20 TaxID=3128146 RepID=A0AAX4QIN1_9CAUD